jgi:hypothetical protein
LAGTWAFERDMVRPELVIDQILEVPTGPPPAIPPDSATSGQVRLDEAWAIWDQKSLDSRSRGSVTDALLAAGTISLPTQADG